MNNLINSIKRQTTKPHQVNLVDDHSPLKIQAPEWFTCFKLDEQSGPAKARNTGKSIALEGGADADKVNFNERFKTAAFEDVEFCIRANQQGYAIKHIPEMVVYHNYGYTGSLLSDTKQFISKFMKYGRAENLLLDEVPDYYDFACKTVEIGAVNSNCE